VPAAAVGASSTSLERAASMGYLRPGPAPAGTGRRESVLPLAELDPELRVLPAKVGQKVQRVNRGMKGGGGGCRMCWRGSWRGGAPFPHLPPAPAPAPTDVATLADRAGTARTELEKMCEITAHIREQCALQERECSTIDGEQERLRRDIQGIMDRVTGLEGAKGKAEGRIRRLREENEQLDTWLQVGSWLLGALVLGIY
jgi:hypothetical protein